jgi:hypothetical protein
VFVTDDPTSDRWFLGDDPPPSPADLRKRVQEFECAIIKRYGLTVSDYRKSGTPDAKEARMLVAGVANELLIPFMSGVDIAKFLGIPRSSLTVRVHLFKLWTRKEAHPADHIHESDDTHRELHRVRKPRRSAASSSPSQKRCEVRRDVD